MTSQEYEAARSKALAGKPDPETLPYLRAVYMVEGLMRELKEQRPPHRGLTIENARRWQQYKDRIDQEFADQINGRHLPEKEN